MSETEAKTNAAAQQGKLYGVSVGPGDPELLTLKAARLIEAADVLAVPDVGRGKGRRSALDIIADHVDATRQEILDCSVPMTRDKAALDAAHKRVADQIAAKLDAGLDVALVTLGDAGIYSSLYYLVDRLRDRGYQVEIVPGVSSFSAASAALAQPLCLGGESLLVVPVATSSSDELDAAVALPGNKVFMKCGRRLSELTSALGRHGQLDGASLAVDLGLPSQRLERDLSQVDNSTGYFSLVLSRGVGGEEDRAGRPEAGAGCEPVGRPEVGADSGSEPGSAGTTEPPAGAGGEPKPGSGPGLEPTRVSEPTPAGKSTPADTARAQVAHEYPFVTHRDCPYFPCHEGVPDQDFNCLFCYCPLYALGPDCGGNYSYNEHGYKDCTACAMPHRGDAGTKLVKLHYPHLAELARRGGSDSSEGAGE